MPRKRRAKTGRPTEAELEILTVLWRLGPSTVRQVHEAVGEARGTSYNTTLKFMQILCEKGMLTRDPTQTPQVFQATIPEEHMQRRLVSDLVARAFGGSARKLVAALTSTDLSPDELQAIRELLDASEETQR